MLTANFQKKPQKVIVRVLCRTPITSMIILSKKKSYLWNRNLSRKLQLRMKIRNRKIQIWSSILENIKTRIAMNKLKKKKLKLNLKKALKRWDFPKILENPVRNLKNRKNGLKMIRAWISQLSSHFQLKNPHQA